MAFIKRLMDHLLNQVLVETLANSRWFQRFAVYTHKLSKEAAEKSKDHSKVLDEHVSTVMDKAKQFTSKMREDFARELKQLQEAEAQQRHMKK
uniref:Uncharacterized protein n=1 Tax=Tetradesmus obliquus TaxID=3088 RepID=A0A383WI98_TETOB|eukprot:jgi/Sobl393_1/8305/SZX76942.1